MKHILNSLLTLIKGIWCWLLNIVLPSHTKRSFFITTVYLNMSNLHEFKQETLTKLNLALTLAEDDNALIMPALLYQLGVVGHGDVLSKYSSDVVQHQSEDEYLRNVCRTIVDVTPKWMQYDRKDDMFKDLLGMFKLLPGASTTHPHYY